MMDRKILKYLRPICSVCEKPVEEMEFASDWHKREIIVLVKCHGETDMCRLNPEIFHFNSIKPGYAFLTRKIHLGIKELVRDNKQEVCLIKGTIQE